MKTFLNSYRELKFTEKFYYTSAFIWVLPIFILAFTLPSYSDTPFYLSLNEYLDQFLFGDIFIQSKYFPFAAKVIGNYMGVTVPIANIMYILFYFIFDRRPMVKKNLPTKIIIIAILAIILAFIMMLLPLYMTYTPQGISTGFSAKYSSTRITYAISASMVYIQEIICPPFLFLFLVNIIKELFLIGND
ncbi:hypothetical protein K7G92_001789 [Pasteurella canis]|uniref:hypothetical protein n=1 Tax=Pasteurella canis TaxID=753 RepID=UPI001E5FC5BC|nr:hypothetical protein [Pasteurella canis]UEA16517.1 hypothetical protein K7G92_001789 [Pasteurella canis]